SDKEKVQPFDEELKEYVDKDADYLDYYDDIKTALSRTSLTDYSGVKDIIKTFEIDNNLILFGTKYGEEGEEFARNWLKVKSSGKEKEYSEPLVGIIIDYANIKSPSDRIGKKMSGNEETRLWRKFDGDNKERTNSPTNILKEEYKNFKWSVTDIENAKYLEIKGQKPDEIIPFTLDGNDLYFYYYLDLDLDEGYDRKDFKIKK